MIPALAGLMMLSAGCKEDENPPDIPQKADSIRSTKIIYYDPTGAITNYEFSNYNGTETPLKADFYYYKSWGLNTSKPIEPMVTTQDRTLATMRKWQNWEPM